ncbi:MAG: hypothetical protein A4E28_02737 [Methanocella sp. PtaU1.Bin125]|nr:MAG: hypothetical protein A4E28_02737 [Methanocella sp. PtaU1.Bin125]
MIANTYLSHNFICYTVNNVIVLLIGYRMLLIVKFAGKRINLSRKYRPRE